MEAKIKFIKGLNENVLPILHLTQSLDGSTRTAIFRFKNPNILYNYIKLRQKREKLRESI